MKPFKASEIWYQDLEDSNLWRGKHGILLNTTALNEREFYYNIIRITSQPSYAKESYTRAYA
jgi:hypothetical protein